VPAPRGVLVLNRGTAGFSADVDARLAPLLADGVARVASEEGLTTITGATEAGVFALFGVGLEGRAPGVCIGVAPAELVTWPGRGPRPTMQRHSSRTARTSCSSTGTNMATSCRR
jgi:SLOG in TRPM, prokaryote